MAFAVTKRCLQSGNYGVQDRRPVRGSRPAHCRNGDVTFEKQSWERWLTFPVKSHNTEETIPMKQTWHGRSTFRIESGEAKISIDPFLSDNPSRDNGWSGCLTTKNSREGGGRDR